MNFNLITSRWREALNTADLCHRMTRSSLPSLVASFVLLIVVAVMSRYCPVHPMLMLAAFLAPIGIQALSGFRVASSLAGPNREMLITTPASTVGWLDGALLWSASRMTGFLPGALVVPAGARGICVSLGLLAVLATCWMQMLMLAHFAELDELSCNYALTNVLVLIWPVLACPLVSIESIVVALGLGMALGTVLLLHLVRWHLELWRTLEPPLALLRVTAIFPGLYLFALRWVLMI